MVWVGSVLEEAEEDWFVSYLDGADEGCFAVRQGTIHASKIKTSFPFEVVRSGQTLFNLRGCGGREEV